MLDVLFDTIDTIGIIDTYESCQEIERCIEVQRVFVIREETARAKLSPVI